MKILLCISALSIFLSSCGVSSAHSGHAKNDKCPITGKAISASDPTVSFDGDTIGFCCNGCVARFSAMPYSQKKITVADSEGK